MRFLLLSLTILYSSQLFAQTMMEAQTFIEDYLSAATSLYQPHNKSASSDSKYRRTLLSQALKLQRMWVKPKNPPQDGLFLRANNGGLCSLKDIQPAGHYIRAHIYCPSAAASNGGNGYYLLAKNRSSWKIKAFSTNQEDLKAISGKTGKLPSQFKYSNPDAQKIGSDTPNSQVEAFMHAVMEKLPEAGTDRARSMAILDPLVKATKGLWLDDRKARRAQAISLSFFLMFSPESYQIEKIIVNGHRASANISIVVGNPSWKRLQPGSPEKTAEFKLSQVDGKWFLLDFIVSSKANNL